MIKAGKSSLARPYSLPSSSVSSFPFYIAANGKRAKKKSTSSLRIRPRDFSKEKKKCWQLPYSSLPDARAQRDQAKCRLPPPLRSRLSCPARHTCVCLPVQTDRMKKKKKDLWPVVNPFYGGHKKGGGASIRFDMDRTKARANGRFPLNPTL